MPVLKFEMDSAAAANFMVKLQEMVRGYERTESAVQKATRAGGAWERQLQKTQKAFDGDAWSRQLDKTAAATQRVTAAAKSMQEAFASGKGGLSAPAARDSWAAGMEKIGTATAKASLQMKELAQASRNAFMSGEGGLSASAAVDRWAAGMGRLRAQTAAAAQELRAARDAFIGGMGGLSAGATGDRWSAGMAQIGAQANQASINAKAAQLAFMSGQGGLSGGINPNRWGAGMMQINADAAAQAAQAKAAQIAGMGGLSVFPERDRWSAGMLNMGSQYVPRGLGAMTMHPLAGFGRQAIEANRFRDALKAIAASAKEAKPALDAAGNAGRDSFGSQMLGQISSYAMGIASIGTAIGLVKQAFDAAKEARDNALGTAVSKQNMRAELSQLAIGNPKEFNRIVGMTDKLSAAYGVPWEDTAKAVFAGKSGDLTNAQIAKAVQAGVIAPGGGGELSSRFMTNIKEIYKGQISPEAGLNVALKMSADSPQLSFRQAVENSSNSLLVAKELGLSFPEYSAIAGKLSTQFGIGERGFERTDLLLSRMSLEEKFKGRGMAGVMDFVRMDEGAALGEEGDTAGMTKEERTKFLGKRMQLQQAFLALRNVSGQLPGYAKELGSVGNQDFVGEGVETLRSNPTARRVMDLHRQQQSETNTREAMLANEAADVSRVFSAEREKDDTRKVWATQRLGRRFYQGVAYALNVDAATAHSMSEFGSKMGAGGPFAAIPEMIDVWSRLLGINNSQEAVLKEISGKLDKEPAKPPPNPNGGGRR